MRKESPAPVLQEEPIPPSSRRQRKATTSQEKDVFDELDFQFDTSAESAQRSETRPLGIDKRSHTGPSSEDIAHISQKLRGDAAHEAALKEIAQLAEAAIDDLPSYMIEARASLFLAGNKARGKSDAERLAVGLIELRKKNPQRVAKILQDLHAYDFQKPASPTNEDIAKISGELRDGVAQEKVQKEIAQLANAQLEELPLSIRKIHGHLFLAGDKARGTSMTERLATGLVALRKKNPERVAEMLRELAAFDFETTPGPTPDQVVQIKRELTQENRSASKETFNAPLIEQVAHDIQGYFVNLPALKGYLAYLQGHEKNNFDDLQNIELPNGQKFADLHWTRNDIQGLVDRLQGHVRSWATEKPQELRLTERDLINRGVDNLMQEIETLRVEIEAQRKLQPLGVKIKNALRNLLRTPSSPASGATEGGMEAKKEELKEKEQALHKILEENKMVDYRNIHSDDVGATESEREEGRALLRSKDSKGRRIYAAAPTTADRAEDFYVKGVKKLFPSKKNDSADIDPPSSEQINERTKSMTVKEAVELLPQAADVWTKVTEQLKTYPETRKMLEEAAYMTQWDTHDTAQNYVYAVAKMIRARRHGDMEFAEQLLENIDRINAALHIDSKEFADFLLQEKDGNSIPLTDAEKLRRSVNDRSRKSAARSNSSRPAGFV